MKIEGNLKACRETFELAKIVSRCYDRCRADDHLLLRLLRDLVNALQLGVADAACDEDYAAGARVACLLRAHRVGAAHRLRDAPLRTAAGLAADSRVVCRREAVAHQGLGGRLDGADVP
eukprot:CAMPEP_0119521638 /NCGR_PEP_ID=MMETSP1344-20130328/37272_1 /TAXON_ID=236787 /ORGANISM="Florenciella parvula, Strain CCMP2471" /LENGTH=118 /DNA_ID=CAMNT_0007559623 /DNA_START=293 /DNA_END=645 /DNA_ORIENTATION=+